jgi:hypothetical protein
MKISRPFVRKRHDAGLPLVRDELEQTSAAPEHVSVPHRGKQRAAGRVLIPLHHELLGA